MLKAVRIAAIVIASLAAVLPWAVYWNELRNVDGRPAPPAGTKSAEAVDAFWTAHEPSLPPDKLADISPYWVYSFAGCIAGLYACDMKAPAGMSHMAEFVALTYLRDGHFTGRKSLHWHMTAICLTIWIQRTMSPADLVGAYVEAETRYKP